MDNTLDIVSLALKEDIGSGDKSIYFLESQNVIATLTTREDCVLFGTHYAQQCLNDVTISWNYNDGDKVGANSILAVLKGDIKEIITKERTVLNFLQTLSATATQTYKLTQKIAHTRAKLLDTRKTLPGLRMAQKEAVLAGGGFNHRMGLYDAIILKENHLMMGSIADLVYKAQQQYSNIDIIVEVETLKELQEVDTLGVTKILCDNFDVQTLRKAVKIVQTPLEVSGNINADNIVEYAETGVEYISIGALTKNIDAIDLSLRIKYK